MLTTNSRKTFHTTFKVRALDDIQSPEPGALCFKKGEVVVVSEIEPLGKGYGTRPDGKKGWFVFESIEEVPTSPRNNGSTNPQSLGTSGSTSSSPSGSSNNLGVVSPSALRSPSKPAARKISSFLWKTREERQNEILGSGTISAVTSIVAFYNLLYLQVQSLPLLRVLSTKSK